MENLCGNNGSHELERIRDFINQYLDENGCAEKLYESICESIAENIDYHSRQLRQNQQFYDLLRSSAVKSIPETEKSESVKEPFDVFDNAIKNFNESKLAALNNEFLDYVNEYTDNIIELNQNSK